MATTEIVAVASLDHPKAEPGVWVRAGGFVPTPRERASGREPR